MKNYSNLTHQQLGRNNLMPYEESKLILDEKETEWHDRKQYAEILRELILSQQTQYKKARDPMKKNKLSHSIAYLIQVQNSIINSEKNLDERISKLEELMKYR